MGKKSIADTGEKPLFDFDALAAVQPSGSPWKITDSDPATVPVPLQTVIVKVDGPYTERDRKLWVFLLHAVFDELGHKPMHSLPVRDINAVFRELGGEHGTDWLWQSVRRLAKTTAEWETTFDDDRFEQGVAAIFGASLTKQARASGTLHFFFPPNLIPMIKNPMRFARLRVHFLIKLSGKYAVTLYEILEGFVNRRDGRLEVSLIDLRQWLKVPPKSYLDWKDFKKRVLDPAVKQINDDPMGAGFTVEYTPMRFGRFYDRVIFKLTKTDGRKQAEIKIKRGTDLVSDAALRLSDRDEEEARKICSVKGLDFYGVYSEWKDFARKKGAPRNIGKAFIAFCEKKSAPR